MAIEQQIKIDIETYEDSYETVVYNANEIIDKNNTLDDLERGWKNMSSIGEDCNTELGYSDEFKEGWNEMVGYLGSEHFHKSFFDRFQKKYPNFARFLKFAINRIVYGFYFCD